MSLTITGSNFMTLSAVSFGSTTVASTTVNATTITATIPSALLASPGTVPVVVTNPAPGGGTASANFAITGQVNGPTLLSILPSPAFVQLEDSATISVSVNIAPTQNLPVSLTTSNSNLAFLVNSEELPTATVTIAAGTTSASIQVEGLDSGTAMVTATAGSLTANVVVNVISTTGSLAVSPSPLFATAGGTASFTVTRSSDTLGTPLTIGLSVAPVGTATVPQSLTFGPNQTQITTSLNGLSTAGSVTCGGDDEDEGSGTSTACLVVGGPNSPSLLTGRVINFVPSGVSDPATVPLQTYSSSNSALFFGDGDCDDCSTPGTIGGSSPFSTSFLRHKPFDDVRQYEWQYHLRFRGHRV